MLVITRRCSRTLTFAYVDSTAVLGPLALRAEPGSYDLCLDHSNRLSVPRGWEVIRLPGELATRTNADDLMSLADAIRRAGLGDDAPPVVQLHVSRRKGHLAVLADPQAEGE